jgi:hypothetical protein
MIVYPKVLGETIDHLISKDYQYIWFLVLNFVKMVEKLQTYGLNLMTEVLIGDQVIKDRQMKEVLKK